MRKAIEITEWCPHCGAEIEFEYDNESDIKAVEKCTCGELLVICNACKNESCMFCEQGSDFILADYTNNTLV